MQGDKAAGQRKKGELDTRLPDANYQAAGRCLFQQRSGCSGGMKRTCWSGSRWMPGAKAKQ